MRTISSELHDALQEPERYGFVLLTFTLGSSVFGIWTGQSEMEYNSIIYGGGGSIIDVDNIEEAGDGSISELTLQLSESPDKGLSVDVLTTFFEEAWHMQSIVIELGMLDPDTGLPIDTTVLFDGVLSQAPLRRSQGKYALSVRCISRAYKMSEQGGKYRNDQTQRLLDPTDTSLINIGIYGQSRTVDLKWGQAQK